MLGKNRRLALLKVGSCSKSINFGLDSYSCCQDIFLIDTREDTRGPALVLEFNDLYIQYPKPKTILMTGPVVQHLPVNAILQNGGHS